MRSKKGDNAKKEVSIKNDLPKPELVDDHFDDAEDDSEETPTENLEYEEEDPGSTEDIAAGKRLARSNSTFFDKKRTSNPIKPADRNTTEDANDDLEKWKDAVIISVISLEAAAQHYKGFHDGLKKGLLFNSEVKGTVDKNIQNELAKNISYTSQKSYANAFSEILKNKEPAHCVPVMEGSREHMPEKFEAQCGSGKKYHYVLNKFYIDGQNGRKDTRQYMHFYLRTDVQQIISFQKTIIHHEKGKSFAVTEIMFSTVDEQMFSVIAVHIPNDFVGSVPICKKTDKFIRDYAEKRKKEGVLVIAYLGDTNYKKPIQQHSCPSLGGNQEKSYVSPPSSGRKEHTYFMQVVSLTKDDRVRVLQPSTLNFVTLNGETPDKTDHPSIQCQILLKSRLQNRQSPKKIGVFEERRSKSSPNLDTKKSIVKKELTFSNINA